MVGTGKAAEHGILFRNPEALERLQQVRVIVFDKTGTLTEGKPKLQSVIAAEGYGELEILSLAASLERGSEHPLASAIVSGAEERRVNIVSADEFASLTGKGIRGRVGGHRVALGNAALIEELQVDASPLFQQAESLRQDGQTAMFVVVDGRVAGIISVADPLKKTTLEAVRLLHDQGLRVIMLTGDNRTTAAAVAQQLGLDQFFAEVQPDRKAEIIKTLQAEGRTVAMAGDGVNDAPALAQADVGLAMGTGTDVAVESAGVTLIRGDLRAIAQARRLSHGTMRNIRQNLFFAFLYNTLGVPLAAGVFYPAFGWLLSPMIASAAMSLSSVSVIANALRLRRLPL
jgi:Cu+-exporting ATPase